MHGRNHIEYIERRVLIKAYICNNLCTNLFIQTVNKGSTAHREVSPQCSILYLYIESLVLDKLITDLGNMHQSILMHADIYKCAKVNHIAHGTQGSHRETENS